jgi:hypothetical protein
MGLLPCSYWKCRYASERAALSIDEAKTITDPDGGLSSHDWVKTIVKDLIDANFVSWVLILPLYVWRKTCNEDPSF